MLRRFRPFLYCFASFGSRDFKFSATSDRKSPGCVAEFCAMRRRRRRAYAPTSNTAAHHNHKKINRPRSIYQYSRMAPRLSGQNCKFLKFLLSLNSQRRLGYKENNTKYRRKTRKPRAHVRILIYRT